MGRRGQRTCLLGPLVEIASDLKTLFPPFSHEDVSRIQLSKAVIL
jgi:hypothetical protein